MEFPLKSVIKIRLFILKSLGELTTCLIQLSYLLPVLHSGSPTLFLLNLFSEKDLKLSPWLLYYSYLVFSSVHLSCITTITYHNNPLSLWASLSDDENLKG